MHTSCAMEVLGKPIKAAQNILVSRNQVRENCVSEEDTIRPGVGAALIPRIGYVEP